MAINKRLIGAGATGTGGLTPSENFAVVTYTGDGSSSRTITCGFQPDWVVFKRRDGSDNWRQLDSSRGFGFVNYWNLTNAQDGSASPVYITASATGFSFTSNGYDNFNYAGNTYVVYCWKANGGTTSSNGDGSITTTVQTNTDAGFSIIKYTGNGTSGATIGHNLGVVPDMFIVKKLGSGTTNWRVYHKGIDSSSPQNYNLALNQNASRFDRTEWNDTAPTSSVFSVNDHESVNENSTEYICYAFADTAGFSKFGSYTGNRPNDVLVETGFEVGWVMIKAVDATDDWFIISQKTGDTLLYANLTNAETSFTGVSFLSNGFMLNGSANSGGTNNAGTTFIYMAFATDPDTETPTLASSFNIETYTGTGSARSITGLGFKPNMTWFKDIGRTREHILSDSVRGAGREISPNTADAEETDRGVGSFDTDGFSFTDGNTNYNDSGQSYVAWTWKANDDEPTILPNTEFSSLISKYKFEDNANDDYAYNNGTASNLSYVSGRYGAKAADFNGSSSKILYPQAAPFNDSNTILAVSAWVKLDSASDEFVIMSASSTSDQADYMMLTVGGNRPGRIFMTDAPSNANEYQANFGSGNDTNWNHYVWQLSAIDGIELWYNGTKQTRTQTYQAGSLDETSWFGNLTYATSVQFATGINRVVTSAYSDGSIDQMRLFNAELTSSEISSLYNEANDALVSANSNAGFSIIKYDGTGIAGTKIPHGLSAAPDMVIAKRLNSSQNWIVYHTSIGATKYLELNDPRSEDTASTVWNDTAPSATNVTFGTSSLGNGSGDNYIMYCFNNVAGYQKFGSYTGNGGTQSITGVGFKPDYLIIKQTNASNSWRVFDSRRDLIAPQTLFPNLDVAEDSESNTVSSFDSDGWTMGSQQGVNDNGDTYIYWAIAKNVPSNTTLANSFKTVTYTGNATARSITGTGFKPDLVWIKGRSFADNHNFGDSVRGAMKFVFPNLTSEELTSTNYLTSFDSDGFSLGTDNSINKNSDTFVAWAWKAGNTWQSNIDGTIASIVNVNTANGFSIVHYYGTQAAGATVGHGLSSAPEMIIVKRLDFAEDWVVYHSSLGNTKTLNLNQSDAEVTDAAFNNTTPTSSVFTLSNCASGSCINSNSGNYIAYCWHSVSGYSKLGSYAGTGSSNSITGLGFQPDWIMIKETDGVDSWEVYDSVRGADKVLYPNGSNAEGTGSNFTSFDSDGFTVSSATSINENGKTYIYMAFKMN